MKKINLDLHIHSIYSGEMLTPKEIVAKAKKRNLQIIALTDHNSVTGVAEFLKEAEKVGLPAFYGVEFTTLMNGRVIHILGYNMDLNDKSIQKLLKISEDHLPNAEKVIEIIRKADGFPVLSHPELTDVTFAEVLRFYGRGLKGIEAFCPNQDPESYLDWAKKLKLAVTAGTDYHSISDRSNYSIGIEITEPLPEGVYLYTGDIPI
ncbi:MAG: PHP domain-containing protein [Halanaerobiales bacterium]|nr:PHP domain-containing protein [Halanaerobiales bacterium]